jgi:hypothetical protein
MVDPERFASALVPLVLAALALGRQVLIEQGFVALGCLPDQHHRDLSSYPESAGH